MILTKFKILSGMLLRSSFLAIPLSMAAGELSTKTASHISLPCYPWSIEAGSGVLWSNVRDSDIPGHTLVPAELTLSRRFQTRCLTDLCSGIFEAEPEILLKGYGIHVWDGVESYIAGCSFGLRYHFVHAPSRWVPFAEATVGAAWADAHQYISDGEPHGLGQDFNFNFAVATGVRYDLTERWFSRLSLRYTHYSNAGLSEPKYENRAIDGLGLVLSVGYRF